MKYTYEDIILSMKNAYEHETGYPVNRGSDEEKQLEAVASELFSLSCYGDYIMEQAFVQSATADNLDKHGELRGVKRKAGAAARGQLCFSISQPLEEDIIVNENTVCSVDRQPLLQFLTTESAVLPAGETQVLVSAEAISQGKKFNVEQNTITVMVNAPVGIESVTNPLPFNGGYDGEPDAPFRQRIIDSFDVPSVFMSVREIENRILQTPGVIDCKILGCESPNELRVVYHTYIDLFADYLRDEIGDEIIDEVYSDIQSEIAEAVGVTKLFGTRLITEIAQPEDVEIDVGVKVYDINNTDISTYVTSCCRKLFEGEKIGQSLSVASMKKALYAIDGVEEVNISVNGVETDCIYCPDDRYLIKSSGTAVILYE